MRIEVQTANMSFSSAIAGLVICSSLLFLCITLLFRYFWRKNTWLVTPAEIIRASEEPEGDTNGYYIQIRYNINEVLYDAKLRVSFRVSGLNAGCNVTVLVDPRDFGKCQLFDACSVIIPPAIGAIWALINVVRASLEVYSQLNIRS